MPRRKGTLKPYKITKGTGALNFNINLTLYPGRDDDLIERLLATPLGKVGASVREMIRNGVSQAKFVGSNGHGHEETVRVEMDEADVDV